MGRQRVDIGDTVLGSGLSPTSGKRLNGKRGVVTDIEDHFGKDLITVEWDGGGTDQVYQDNLSGTQQGNRFRHPDNAVSDEGDEPPRGKRRWGRRG